MATGKLTVTVRVADVNEWKAVVEAAARWVEFYGVVENFGDDERYMTQLEHGHEEYAARISMVAALRALADAHVALETVEPS